MRIIRREEFSCNFICIHKYTVCWRQLTMTITVSQRASIAIQPNWAARRLSRNIVASTPPTSRNCSTGRKAATRSSTSASVLRRQMPATSAAATRRADVPRCSIAVLNVVAMAELERVRMRSHTNNPGSSGQAPASLSARSRRVSSGRGRIVSAGGLSGRRDNGGAPSCAGTARHVYALSTAALRLPPPRLHREDARAAGPFFCFGPA